MSTFSNNRSLPNELHRWTVTNSQTALNSILGDLNASSSQIEQYVVRKSPDISENQERGSSSNEPIEVSFYQFFLGLFNFFFKVHGS